MEFNVWENVKILKIHFLYLGTADDTLADISEVLNTEDDILGIISDDLAKSVDHSGILYAVCLVSVLAREREVHVCGRSLVFSLKLKKIFWGESLPKTSIM